ncbi:PadR family transcriptional regulator [Clostridium sp. 19966]|uniref:PadR family transcriptional regulator n=1 Tax=Clostridium sp. 19966 TaxID=2768166 RepID=UPI0028EAC2E6|nr:PadR family transcriptional regulator [Clostridium sp. 19966]
MMNEFYILAELMEEPQNGYQLRSAMQTSLGPNRKISFGVIYPLLDKLADLGFVELIADKDAHNKKIAMITEKGKAYFFELMEKPVPKGSYRADIFSIKLDAMQHLSTERQFKLLEEFFEEQQMIIADTEKAMDHLAKKKSKDHYYALKKLDLRLRQAKEAIRWIEDFREDLKKGI